MKNSRKMLKVLFLIFLMLAFLFSGCLEEKRNEAVENNITIVNNDVLNKTIKNASLTSNQTGDVWPKKVKGGYLDIVRHDYEIEKGEHAIIGWLSDYNFFSNGYLIFNKEYRGDEIEKIQISFDTHHYFILSPRTRRFNIALKHDTQEFPGWNLKLEFNETNDSVIVHETYRFLTQNESEVKEIIASYREKPISAIHISGSYRPEGLDTGSDYSRSKEAPLILQQDVDNVFNSLLSYNFTNERFDKNLGDQIRGPWHLEEETEEKKYVEFEDGSSFDIYMYSIHGILTGIITVPEGTFVFSK